MHRFLYNGPIDIGAAIFLPADESHHIKTVLRLQPGEEVELFDGKGRSAKTCIMSICNQVNVKVLASTTKSVDTGSSLLVGQGLLKTKKMDLAVQKCTELGVSTFIPVLSSRCQTGNVVNLAAKKQKRWQRIIESGCKQCGRNQLMGLNELISFEKLLTLSQEVQPDLKLIFWEKEKKYHLSDLQRMRDHQKVMIVLGPEGGFSTEEVHMAQSYGYRSISLGNCILRAETATISAVAILQNMLGNMV